ncbi:hydroxymethylpyrimidine/phosphomethylpyrimidine kinase [Myroides odoratimimus]|uniref:hydroxymethylpyrimidine/phosphomethylpyrimidine kinase n=1 Tax=Myroides odoratimimus TaxID=76832 RepID=UPI0010404DE7|nr:hydroxymethylpyrimidine/phosphomethylpyrimidine kinase [Myroides odoratimimus]MCA4791642.1 hydroxymethylpyrimidine/phosphomethylpyrimidine kinase [Myroides odoratimimus]MCA4806083.1 hydroxymethylpyrimidine/phosphomethylpyrimidine kinase [Myroides odoratimimus]MCA4818903.1 hydroxymethylpyrimidine/phosphomethylpyrimidine kinase [Myroides odoratimimus]MCO7722172.1 hydroxymethylpyrimidine/phosphomethylpyrimidine kinase [Myroides odoratimimus]MDM1057672.1 hydroxymethylpyrimidine/phosphomethylpyr
MSILRPIALAIAGFDPTSGAGVMADIKTFEHHQVYPMAVLSANTIQTEDNFIHVRWEEEYTIRQLSVILESYTIAAVKIGIVKDLDTLKLYVDTIKSLSPTTKIIWDPVLRSSSGFDFQTIELIDSLTIVLQQIDLITPNYLEIHQLVTTNDDALQKAQRLSQYCDVLLKGGHNPNALGFDYYVSKEVIQTIPPTQLYDYPKHGSGCVLSSATTANIAKGDHTLTAIQKAKTYIETFFNSNHTLLGYHAK